MTPAELKREVLADCASFEHDPLGWVLWAFPWGVAGTPLEREDGPDEWQRQQLTHIRDSLRANPFAHVRDAMASGHGIGKTAEIAWLILWALTTKGNTRGVVTANTDTQLRTKTWAEVAKWHRLMLAPLRECFVMEATSVHAKAPHDRTWRIDAIPWSERNPEAFAGLHNAGGRVFMAFDEASAIADVIWETAEGATTDADTEVIWLAYGNPTKNTGRFKEVVVGRLRHMWSSRQIDSRTVKRTNKETLDALVAAYGEDSDFVRVRVKGEFPRASSMQFIPSDLVQAARKREIGYIASAPIVWGLDVARYGDDASVLAGRRGRDARSFPWKRWRKLDTMTIAADAYAHMTSFPGAYPDAVFVDVSGGLGAGVADRLRQIDPHLPVIDVNFGGEGGEVMLENRITMRAWNMSAKMWMLMRDWLQYGAIPDDDHLEADLTGREYGYAGADQAIMLERKEDMKKRGLASPDDADALGLTFAYPVAARRTALDQRRAQALAMGVQTDYDVHADLR